MAWKRSKSGKPAARNPTSAREKGIKGRLKRKSGRAKGNRKRR